MKRVFDFLVSLVGLFLLIPLLGLLSLLIKFTSKGTIFFFQERVGENGVFFKMIKFRSMQMIQDSDSTISVKVI